jgi:hypothetical protein
MAVVITLIVASVLLVVGAVGTANRTKHRLRAPQVNDDGPATAAHPRITWIARIARHTRFSAHTTHPAKELS